MLIVVEKQYIKSFILVDNFLQVICVCVCVLANTHRHTERQIIFSRLINLEFFLFFSIFWLLLNLIETSILTIIAEK